MSPALVLRDHEELQSAVGRTALVGAGAGLLHALLPGPLGDAIGLCAVGLAVVPPRTLASAAIAGVMACAAVAALGLPHAIALAVLAVCGGALYARDLEGRGGRRRLVAAVGGAAALAGGLFVASGLRAGVLAALGIAPAFGWLVAGGAAGLCAGLGVAGREVGWRAALPPSNADRPALASGDRLEPGAPDESGELGALLERAAFACRQARESLGDAGGEAVRAATDLLARIATFAARWRDLDRQLAGLDRAELCRRADEMSERSRAALDEEVANEYRRAERALRQQTDDLDAIRGWQERSLARLHHHVAVLERLRLAALHRRSVATGRSGDELSGLVDELARAGLELDGAAELEAALPAAS